MIEFFVIAYLSIGLVLYYLTCTEYENDNQETKETLKRLNKNWLSTFLYVVLLWPDAIIQCFKD